MKRDLHPNILQGIGDLPSPLISPAHLPSPKGAPWDSPGLRPDEYTHFLILFWTQKR